MSVRFSIIFGFRNREAVRVRRCFESLSKQRFDAFEVILVDFGSDPKVAAEIQALCESFPFVRYIYSEARGLPWNRARCLNTGVRFAKGEYILFGDVDLIYAPNFLESVDKEAQPGRNLYGEYYRLDQNFNAWDSLAQLDVSKLQSFGPAGKGGVHAVLRDTLETIRGYDEFYCFWGVEDRDLHARLTLLGLQEYWMSKQAPVFHQWHPLTSDLHQSGLPLQWWEEMNLYFHRNKRKTVRNEDGWGTLLMERDRPVLSGALPEKVVPLNSSKQGAVAGKAEAIRIIYEELASLGAGAKLRFVFEKRESTAIPSLPTGRQLFGSQIIPAAEWNTFQAGFAALLERHAMLEKRMNYFLREQDLPYIFWQIIRAERDFDFAIVDKPQQMEWLFARR